MNDHSGEFNLRARGGGWPLSQMQVRFTGSPTFTVVPAGTNHLDENLLDLEPRAHVYVTAGATNIPVTFSFNTTTQAFGYHDLTAVVYEGSHVRTQQRIMQTVIVSNGPLTAKIWIQNGEVIDSEAGDLRGESAFKKILSWKTGNFETLPAEPSRPSAI